MRPSIRSELPSQRFPAALGKLKTDRIARHAESMRDSWQIILSDIEEEREDG